MAFDRGILQSILGEALTFHSRIVDLANNIEGGLATYLGSLDQRVARLINVPLTEAGAVPWMTEMGLFLNDLQGAIAILQASFREQGIPMSVDLSGMRVGIDSLRTRLSNLPNAPDISFGSSISRLFGWGVLGGGLIYLLWPRRNGR